MPPLLAIINSHCMPAFTFSFVDSLSRSGSPSPYDNFIDHSNFIVDILNNTSLLQIMIIFFLTLVNNSHLPRNI